jgi:uncharacterized protein YkwD
MTMSNKNISAKNARIRDGGLRHLTTAVLGLCTPMLASAQISSADAQALLQRHNDVRAQVNSGALCMNQQLMQAAEAHCQDMAANNFFSHTGSDGSSAGTRISATGYSFRTWGENIAKGQPSAAAVMSAWENSSGHYNNIVNANFREVGLARCGSNIWVVNFATQRSGQASCSTTAGSSGQAPAPTPAPTVPPTASDPGLAVYQACQAYTDNWHFIPNVNRYRIWWNNSCYQYNPSNNRLSIMRQDSQGLWKFFFVR